MSVFRHLFRQRFHLARHLSTNARGEHEYSEPTVHACRYEGSLRRITTADGTDAVAEAVLYTTEAVSAKDTVYPPGTDPEDINAGRQPLAVTPRHSLLTGKLDHYEVHLGAA